MQVMSDASLEERAGDLEELIGVLEDELETTSKPESLLPDTP